MKGEKEAEENYHLNRFKWKYPLLPLSFTRQLHTDYGTQNMVHHEMFRFSDSHFQFLLIFFQDFSFLSVCIAHNFLADVSVQTNFSSVYFSLLWYG